MPSVDLDQLDYSEWFDVIYWEAAPNEQYPDYEWDAGWYPDIISGTYNPYNPAFMWNWKTKHWVPVYFKPNEGDMAIITSSHMANGYEVQYGNNALYGGITKSSGTVIGAEAYSYNGNKKGDVGVLVPTTAIPVVDPASLVVEVYYPGSHVPVTITVYDESDTVIGTSSGNSLLRIIPLNWSEDPDLIDIDYIGPHPLETTDKWDSPSFHHEYRHLDSLGYIHGMSFTLFWYTVLYYTNGTGSWTFLDLDPDNEYWLRCFYDDCVWDSQGKIHGVFDVEYSTPTPNVDTLSYITNASGSWEITHILSVASDEDLYFAHICLDANDTPHIIYLFHEDTGPVDTIKYIYWTGSAWSSPVTVCDGAAYGYYLDDGTTFVVNGDGTRRLVFTTEQDGGDLYMHYSTGGAFNSYTLLNRGIDGSVHAFSVSAVRTGDNTFEIYYTKDVGTDEYRICKMSGTFNPVYCGNEVENLVSVAGITAASSVSMAQIGKYYNRGRGACIDEAGRRYIPLYDETWNAEKNGFIYSDNGVTWEGKWNYTATPDYSETYNLHPHHVTGNRNYGDVIFNFAQSFDSGTPYDYGEFYWAWNYGYVLEVDRIEIDYDNPDEIDQVIFDGYYIDGAPQTPIAGAWHDLEDDVEDLGVFLVPHLIID